MSKGLGRLQRDILDLLPDAADYPDAKLFVTNLDDAPGLAVKHIADRLYGDGARPSQWNLLINRALRSLQGRGLVEPAGPVRPRRYTIQAPDGGSVSGAGFLPTIVWRRTS